MKTVNIRKYYCYLMSIYQTKSIKVYIINYKWLVRLAYEYSLWINFLYKCFSNICLLSSFTVDFFLIWLKTYVFFKFFLIFSFLWIKFPNGTIQNAWLHFDYFWLLEKIIITTISFYSHCNEYEGSQILYSEIYAFNPNFKRIV